MPSPLPCQGGLDGQDSCHLPNPCRSKREVDAGMRTVEWILEHERCPELVARDEGWVVPCES